jgi:hypothetical protein
VRTKRIQITQPIRTTHPFRSGGRHGSST